MNYRRVVIVPVLRYLMFNKSFNHRGHREGTENTKKDINNLVLFV